MVLRLPHLVFIGVVLALALWIGSYEWLFGLIFLVGVGLCALRLRYPRSLHGMHRNTYAVESTAQRIRRSIEARETLEAERRRRVEKRQD